MFKKNEKEQIRKDNAREVLGDELFFDLKEIEVQSMLDYDCLAILTDAIQ